MSKDSWMVEEMVARRLDAPPRSMPTRVGADDARLRAAIVENFDAVWRFLRRLGLTPADADDAAQNVMMIVAEKLKVIEPGRERSFMFGTAFWQAKKVRQARGTKGIVGDDELEDEADPGPGPEVLSDQRRAREVLDQVLDALPMELRAVFVLAELDELPAPQVAVILGLPVGTVASRLRRAREAFDNRLSRLLTRTRSAGGEQ